MHDKRRRGPYLFRGYIRNAIAVEHRLEFSVVSALCLAMAFGGGYLIGSCIG